MATRKWETRQYSEFIKVITINISVPISQIRTQPASVCSQLFCILKEYRIAASKRVERQICQEREIH